MEVSIIEHLENLALPGKCYYCGGVDKEFYLDTGIQIEFYGALYICNECVSFIANKVGFITPVQATELRAKVEQYYLLFVEKESDNNRLRGILDDMVKLGYSSDSLVQYQLDLVALHKLAEAGPSETTSTDGIKSREITEPLHDEGVGILSDAPIEHDSFSLRL